ncbi:hypothetical protein ABZY58_11285 [Micromonospora tulbaghiae]|uniref:hypothetical protein n=1 Tax=Micromonospora tulbaghiae TaxID=479978 RepID=UPI0033ACC123
MSAGEQAARWDRVADRAEWGLVAVLWAAVVAVAALDGVVPWPLRWLLLVAVVAAFPLVGMRVLAAELAGRYREAAAGEVTRR